MSHCQRRILMSKRYSKQEALERLLFREYKIPAMYKLVFTCFPFSDCSRIKIIHLHEGSGSRACGHISGHIILSSSPLSHSSCQ
ncbi:hypothetical protein GDO81_015023 [Engystomops pustulosus]|uniref:Ribosomal protein S14 n=1 Tax=Engystomops pustulosus TaxID=76066 RepID=A0AAV7AG76_ENGPU|nr:hypothetical protein GDO81_015023 [Engystomops pustulosus]